MAAVTAIIISYSQNKTFDFKDLVSRNVYSHADTFHVQLSVAANASGVISPTDTAFLFAEFQWPGHDMEAWYKCEVFGMNVVGRPVTIASTAVHVSLDVERFTATSVLTELTPTLSTIYLFDDYDSNNIDKNGDGYLDDLNGGWRKLSINCTLPNSVRRSHMVTLHALTIQHSYQGLTGNFTELVSLTTDNVTHSFDDRVFSPKGQLSTINASFVAAMLTYTSRHNLPIGLREYWGTNTGSPTKESRGWYRCDALGTDSVGHAVVFSSDVIQVNETQLLAADGVQLVARPDVFIPDTTRHLQMSCVLSNATKQMAFIKGANFVSQMYIQFLFKANNGNSSWKNIDRSGMGYLHFRPDWPYPLPTRYYRSGGMLSPDDSSYYTVSYTMPRKSIAGMYKCEIGGPGPDGKTVVLSSNIIDIKALQPVMHTGLRLSMDPEIFKNNVTTDLWLNCSLPERVREQTMVSLTSLAMTIETRWNCTNNYHCPDLFTLVSKSAYVTDPLVEGHSEMFGIKITQTDSRFPATGPSVLMARVHLIKSDNIFLNATCKATGVDALGRHVVVTSSEVVIEHKGNYDPCIVGNINWCH